MTNYEARRILGVDIQADAAQIKAAYRQLAMKHHPDRGGKNEDFVKIKAAYDALEAANFAQPQASDAFTNAFAGFNFTQQPGHPVGPDIRKVSIEISAEEAFNGVKKSVSIENTSYKITIPAGVSEQDMVHEAVINNRRWILFVKIKSKFSIDWTTGSRGNVKMDIPVSSLKMMLGGQENVTMLDGTVVSVRIPPGLEANSLLKVKEKGYWRNQGCRGRGDCLLRIIPKIQKLSEIPAQELSDFVSAIEKMNRPQSPSEPVKY